MLAPLHEHLKVFIQVLLLADLSHSRFVGAGLLVQTMAQSTISFLLFFVCLEIPCSVERCKIAGERIVGTRLAVAMKVRKDSAHHSLDLLICWRHMLHASAHNKDCWGHAHKDL